MRDIPGPDQLMAFMEALEAKKGSVHVSLVKTMDALVELSTQLISNRDSQLTRATILLGRTAMRDLCVTLGMDYTAVFEDMKRLNDFAEGRLPCEQENTIH